MNKIPWYLRMHAYYCGNVFENASRERELQATPPRLFCLAPVRKCQAGADRSGQVVSIGFFFPPELPLGQKEVFATLTTQNPIIRCKGNAAPEAGWDNSYLPPTHEK